jgi:hypothetical protein
LLQLSFELFKKRERVGGRAGKSRNHAVVIKLAHFLGRMFEHRLSKRHLTVPGDHDFSAMTDGYYGCPVKHLPF